MSPHEDRTRELGIGPKMRSDGDREPCRTVSHGEVGQLRALSLTEEQLEEIISVEAWISNEESQRFWSRGGEHIEESGRALNGSIDHRAFEPQGSEQAITPARATVNGKSFGLER